MFNVELYTTFNLLFITKFFFQNNLQNKPTFLIIDFQWIMNTIESNIEGKNFDCKVYIWKIFLSFFRM
jgi:hypothetical protein